MQTKEKLNKIRTRGTACYDPNDNSFEFSAYNEAPSTQTNVKKCAGGGKRWTTTGADPSKMITLKTKESSPDQYSDLLTQFNALTKDLKPKQPVKQPERLRVVAEEGLECWVNEQQGKMTFTGTIDLQRHCGDWQAEVLRHVQLIVRRLPASDRFNKVMSKIKKQIRNV